MVLSLVLPDPVSQKAGQADKKSRTDASKYNKATVNFLIYLKKNSFKIHLKSGVI